MSDKGMDPTGSGVGEHLRIRSLEKVIEEERLRWSGESDLV